MWTWSKRAILIGLAGWIYAGITATAQTFFTEQITTESGLPSNTIRCAIRTTDNETWIGTDAGLVKWNGKSNNIYRQQNLPDRKIQCITQGQPGEIWAGTSSKGLCLIRKDKSVRVFTTKNGLSSDQITSVYFSEKQKKLFVGTRHGLSVGDSTGFYAFRTNKIEISAISENDSCLIISTNGKGLFYYHFTKKNVFPIHEFAHIKGSTINYIHFTSWGDTIIQVQNQGLLVINKQTRDHYPLETRIQWIAEGNNKDIWIAPSENEAPVIQSVYLIRNTQLIPINHHLTRRAKAVNVIWKEPFSGSIFMGTSGSGILALPSMMFEQYEAKSEYHQYRLSDLCEDANHNLWVVGDHQWRIPLLPIKLPYQLTFRTEYFNDFLVSPSSDFTQTICKNQTGAITLQNQKIYKIKESLKKTTPILEHIQKCDFLKVIDNKIIAQHSSRIWLYNDEGTITEASIHHEGLIAQVEKFANSYWLLSQDGHITNASNDLSHQTLINEEHPFIPSSITAMATDGKEYLFVTDGYETLILLTEKKGQLLEFERWQIGKDFPGHYLHWILIDTRQNLWIGTDKGLTKMDLPLFLREGHAKFINWGRGEGYDCANSFKAIESSTGWIWVLSDAKLMRFYPDNLQHQPSAPRIKLTHITKNGIEANVSQLVKTRFFGGQSNAIDLASNENTLSFSFDAQDLTNTERIHYQYQLLPQETDYGSPTQQPMVYYPALSPGRYRLKVRVYYEHMPTHPIEQEYPFTINPPIHRSIYAFIFYAIVTIIVVLMVLDIRIRGVKRQEEQKNKNQQRMALLKMEALQSQMNPHFIFNALNSLQCSVLENDTEKSLHFIGLFSKLMRSTLDNASRHLISLKEELDYLNNYIEVEKMRFSDGFEYVISVAENIETDSLYLPPMLLQPHIENSIKYAFTSSSIGYIIINFSKVDNNLICMIEDNGVGRSNTQHRKRSHQPRGQSITRERFEILNEFYKTFNDYKFEIEDIYDHEQNPAGTRVTLIFPIIDAPDTYLEKNHHVYPTESQR